MVLDDHFRAEGVELLRWTAPRPPAWSIVQVRNDGGKFFNRTSKLTVIVSLARYQDGKRWLHLSISHKKRLPSYHEMKQAKKAFMDEDGFAYQVFAPKSEHVNIHSTCLHLWQCLDGPVMPDFTVGLGAI